MAGLNIVGYIGSEEIARDQFLPTQYSEWEGPQEYAACHFLQLPVDYSNNNKKKGSSSSGNDKSTTTGVKVQHLSREVETYQNPATKYNLDELFGLQKKYLNMYKTQIEKEFRKEQDRKKRMNELESKTIPQMRQEIEEKEMKEKQRRERALRSMMDVTAESESRCKPFLEAFDFDVKMATEEYFAQQRGH